MLHAMMMEVTNGRLFYAPIDANPQKIVDLGTGTGIWAIEGKRPLEVLFLAAKPSARLCDIQNPDIDRFNLLQWATCFRAPRLQD